VVSVSTDLPSDQRDVATIYISMASNLNLTISANVYVEWTFVAGIEKELRPVLKDHITDYQVFNRVSLDLGLQMLLKSDRCVV
jgi:hypothetical protein